MALDARLCDCTGTSGILPGADRCASLNYFPVQRCAGGMPHVGSQTLISMPGRVSGQIAELRANLLLHKRPRAARAHAAAEPLLNPDPFAGAS